MTIHARLRLAALVPVLMALVIGAALYVSNGAMKEARRKYETAHQLVNSVNELNNLVPSYLLHHEERPRRQFLLEHASATALIAGIQPKDSREQELLEGIRRSGESMKASFLKLVTNHERSAADENALLLREAEERLAGQLLVKSRNAVSDTLRLQGLITDNLARVQRTVNLLTFCLIAVTTFPLTVVLLRMTRSITASLAALRQGTQVVAAGNLEHRVGMLAQDEIGELARVFDGMTERLASTTVSRDALSREVQERKRAEASVQQSLRRFELLAVTAGELLQTREPQKLVESLCRKLMEQLDCHVFFNFLVDEQAGKLHLNACAGIPDDQARRIEWLDYGVAVCGCAARDGCRIVAEHIPTTPDPRTDLVKSYGIKAYACHPLLGPGGKVIGTLSFGTRSRETFREDDLSLMKAVADQVAVAMVRLRDEQQLKQWSQTLEQRVAEQTVEVEKERQRFNSVLDILPAYVVLLSPDYHVPFANRFFEERFGKSNGKRCYEYLFSRTEPCENCETYKALKTNAPHRWEWTGPDDRDYDIYDFPFTDSDGSPLIMEMGIDITERKRAEAALKDLNETLEQRVAEQTASLRASEQRVRQKLDSVLSPEGDTGSLDLADIIDGQAIQSLMDDFYTLAHVPMSIIDLKGKVLVGVGWQDVCTKFHRVHPETCRHCLESDLQLSADVPAGQARLYKCRNNMWDIATPIMVGGRHVGNLFSGQFFFEDEPLDYDLFRSQARQYAFDEAQYLAAIEAVPRLSRESVDTGMAFFMKLAHMLSQLSYSNIKLARSLAQREALTNSLRASEEQLQQINQTLERRVAERTAEAEQRAVQLRALAAELAQAEQRERKRIAHILHDHFQQLLVGAKFDLSIIGSGAKDPQIPQDLDRVSQVLSEAIEASRSLAIELSPPVLHDAGLTGGLAWLGRWMHEKHRLPVDVRVQAGAEPGDENVRVVLFHAVQELLLNVVKHARAAAAQVAVARSDDHLVRITVCDDGVGFAPDVANRDGHGSGFGLFSIRERLRWLGGDLAIDSQPGKGTRIVLSVPLAAPPVDVSQDLASPPTRSPGLAVQPSGGEVPAVSAGVERASIRVLLADDHQVVRDGLSRLLQMQAGITVVGQASDGLEAVALALQTQPDVVIMDITMPGLTGIGATRRILGQLPNTRVIGLSMHAEDEMASAMRQAGAVAYLAKTSGPDALIDAIRAATACPQGNCM